MCSQAGKLIVNRHCASKTVHYLQVRPSYIPRCQVFTQCLSDSSCFCQPWKYRCSWWSHRASELLLLAFSTASCSTKWFRQSDTKRPLLQGNGYHQVLHFACSTPSASRAVFPSHEYSQQKLSRVDQDQRGLAVMHIAQPALCQVYIIHRKEGPGEALTHLGKPQSRSSDQIISPIHRKVSN